MSAVHTPGPWVLTETRGQRYVRAASDVPGIIAIASICKRGGYSETAANAALIVAAPDLLEALEENTPTAPGPKGLCHVGICHEAECGNCQRIARARAAIAKARGRA